MQHAGVEFQMRPTVQANSAAFFRRRHILYAYLKNTYLAISGSSNSMRGDII